MISGGTNLEGLPLILLVSAPIGIVEGYGITLTIKDTEQNHVTKALAYIYGVFFVALVMEVGFINPLITVAS